jgi:hypothetical protein
MKALGCWLLAVGVLAGCGDDSSPADVPDGADADADVDGTRDAGDADGDEEGEVDGGGDADGDGDGDGDAEADSLVPWSRTLIVLTTDYSSGGVSLIDLDTIPAATVTTVGAATAHPDAVLVCRGGADPAHAGEFFVVERTGSNRIRLLKAGSGAVSDLGSLAVEAGSNPQDVVPIARATGSQLAVPLYERSGLAFAAGDLSGIEQTLDLAPLADADALPEMYRGAVLDTTLLVSLQLMNRTVTPWAPTGTGVLAAIALDASSDHVLLDVDASTAGTQGVKLLSANPMGPMRVVSDGTLTRLLVSTVGLYGVNDGGIEAVSDPLSGRSTGFVVTEAALGGDISDWIVVAGITGFAIVTAAYTTDRVVRFNASSGMVDPEPVLESAGYTLSALADLGDGRIAVGDRTGGAAGMRVFDASSKAEITTTPIGVGLPPVMACLGE